MFSHSETNKNHHPTVSREERREHNQLHPPLGTEKKKPLRWAPTLSAVVLAMEVPQHIWVAEGRVFHHLLAVLAA